MFVTSLGIKWGASYWLGPLLMLQPAVIFMCNNYLHLLVPVLLHLISTFKICNY